jgi:lipoprotein-anchoring transpeptidase ErfK/SrfK
MEKPENQPENSFVTDASSLGLVEAEVVGKEKFWKRFLKVVIIILIYLGCIPFMLLVVPKISEIFIPVFKTSQHSAVENNENQLNSLKTEIRNLEKKVEKLTPGNVYMVINTTENRFTLYKNRKDILGGICSTGSYVSLEGEGNKKWVFKTPRGDFKVLTKLTNPVWRKPDWAFVEEGLPIPSPNHPSRYEKGVLGDYALAIGNGYLIHGTLYQRFLGMPVTHGCIRMSDADLKVVYNTLPVGAKVFIY